MVFPDVMQALVVGEGKKVELEQIPIPTLEINEVLIRIHPTAQNPRDWKHTDFLSPVGNVIGCDFSGTVVKLGSDSISRVKVGDTVAAHVHGGTYKTPTAFSPSVLSFEEAATMNCALWTVIQAFYLRTGLEEPSSAPSKNEWILIYGGSSEPNSILVRKNHLIYINAASLGLFSIQLAKLSGYKVVTTTSPKNFDLLKSLGADIVINYRDTDIVEQIQKATENSLKLAFDTVGETDAQIICVKSLAPTPDGARPGKVMVSLIPNEDAKALRKDVIVLNTVIYTAFGRSFELAKIQFPASPEDRAHMASWMPKLEELAAKGQIKPNPVRLWPGGLGAVNEGFQYMREGKVSAEKIVYNVH
ncbi:NADPH quinone reductase [Rhizoctonia solani]|uniref:NADPH quinone reductase n=1 Tax=Rhizoctonia solani TaxID=456999 RepID=A0A8H7H9L2_9AGAM|nr:NADPH quinone reductase [Rhizoctonia solani]